MCIEACATYCDLAALLINGAAPEPAVDVVIKDCRNAHVTAALVNAAESSSSDALRGPQGGFVLWSLRVGVWSILNAPDVQEGVVSVISLGGDTDTNAAIAGGLLGAHFGRQNIPERWRLQLHLGQQLEEAAADLVGGPR